jgi:hypothetical protein
MKYIKYYLIGLAMEISSSIVDAIPIYIDCRTTQLLIVIIGHTFNLVLIIITIHWAVSDLKVSDTVNKFNFHKYKYRNDEFPVFFEDKNIWLPEYLVFMRPAFKEKEINILKKTGELDANLDIYTFRSEKHPIYGDNKDANKITEYSQVWYAKLKTNEPN